MGRDHYRKLRPDTRTSFDQLILAEAGELIDSPSYHGIGRKVGRAVQCPKRRAQRVKKFVLGRTTSHHAESMRVYGTFHTNVAKDRLSSTPFVSMVQAAYLSNGNDTALLWSIDGSRLRGVFRQG